MLQVHAYIEAAAGTGQDRIQWVEGDILAVALADGAGGMGGGTLAAETVVKAATERLFEARHMLGGPEWLKLLVAMDKHVAATRDAGETTLVALQSDGVMVGGASVGDSEAWIVDGADVRVLTADQQRKPLVGSEATSPMTFAGPLRGTLLVASDGLFRFVHKGKIVETISKVSLPELPKALVDLTRLRSGKLQDDVAVLIARMAS